MSGPSFVDLGSLDRCHVTDILPTMLRVSGLPVSDDMDGRVLDEILVPEIKDKPLTTVTSFPMPSIASAKGDEDQLSVPESVEQKIRKNLQSLGYIQ